MNKDAVTKDAVPAVVGCACNGYLTAIRSGFLHRVGTNIFLASDEGHSGSNLASSGHGPQISFCPFCGTSLGSR